MSKDKISVCTGKAVVCNDKNQCTRDCCNASACKNMYKAMVGIRGDYDSKFTTERVCDVTNYIVRSSFGNVVEGNS